MKVTFTDIQWRNNDDMDVFNAHALESIELEGLESGIVTIKCAANTFKAPYCDLTFGGGFTHYEFKTKHPFEIGAYILIAIFSGRVCVAHCDNVLIKPWFDYKCRTYIPTF